MIPVCLCTKISCTNTIHHASLSPAKHLDIPPTPLRHHGIRIKSPHNLHTLRHPCAIPYPPTPLSQSPSPTSTSASHLELDSRSRLRNLRRHIQFYHRLECFQRVHLLPLLPRLIDLITTQHTLRCTATPLASSTTSAAKPEKCRQRNVFWVSVPA